MEESVDHVAESLTKLEVAVAEGFVDNKERFLRLEVAIAKGFVDNRQQFREAELRDAAADCKIDANTERLETAIRKVQEAVTAVANDVQTLTRQVDQVKTAVTVRPRRKRAGRP